MVSSHALAASIRSSQQSDTFDLGNLSRDAITAIIEGAFAQPFQPLPPLLTNDDDSGKPQMIRLTLIIGAGRQARQRYDDDAGRIVMSTLSEKCGYREDRGASSVMECGGSYKFQHDTGKNLKTVVVFPKIATAAAAVDDGGDAGGDGTNAKQKMESIITENSPGYKIAISSLPIFKTMISSKCPSWSEKKNCLESITALLQLVAECDQKLMVGNQLDGSERSFYDDVVDLEEKEMYVRHEVSDMVERGRLTKYELDILLVNNAERIATLEEEGRSTTRAVERRKVLEEMVPKAPGGLRHEDKLVELYRELAPLVRMEDAARGRLLSVKETQTLARKEEIMDEIEYLEEASRGWFEDDEAFESRLEVARLRYAKQGKVGGSGGGGGGGGGGARRVTASAASLGKIRAPAASTTRWVTPGSSQGWSKGGTGKKKKKGKGGGVFSAMMVDSDSESEDEDEDSGEEEVVEAGGTTQETTASSNSSNVEGTGKVPAKGKASGASSSKKSKCKKKKKKKGGGGGGGKQAQRDTVGEDEALAAAVAENAEDDSKKEEEQTALAQAFTFLTTYIIPFIVAILTWIIGLIFGKPKNKNKKKTR